MAFADDLLLMTPSRSTMEKMLNICEKYALDLNLEFSTNADPKKSKSKAIFMTGSKLRNIPKPEPLQLYGKNLPFVPNATHLGHELHQTGTMYFDTKIKRVCTLEILLR